MRAKVLLVALAASSCQPSAEDQMRAIHNQVAQDAMAQFRMVEKSGTEIDKCVQAGAVSAAFLQEKNEAEYAHWKTVENLHCANAGVPR